jgi:outer membrane protein TolC
MAGPDGSRAGGPTLSRRWRSLLVASALVVVAWSGGGGCSPEWYQKDADLQVDRLLRDRKRQTLSYEPVAEAENKPTPNAPGRPYERIPVTPIPVASGHVMERSGVELPFEVLGPVNMAGSGVSLEPVVGDFRSSVRERPLDLPVLGPPSPTRELVRLDLFGVLRYAVRNSRDYSTQMETLYLSALDVTLQRHLLSPRPFVTQSVGYSGGPVASGDYRYQNALNATTSAGVRQRLPYGGEVVAQSLVTFVDALNNNATSGETAQAQLTASVPLLRGAGFVNLEGLISSERQLVYDIRSFETYRRAFLVSVASQYYDLLVRRSQVLNRRQQLANYIDLTERSRALFAAGKGSFLDVQRSLNSQIQGETSLIQAEEAFRANLDAFKVSLGMDPQVDLEIVPVEVDIAIPERSAEDAVSLAQLYRLDVQTARDQIDDAKRQVENAKNGLLPDLNLNAGTSYGNRASSPARDLSSDTGQYNVGATLGLPVDRVAERNAYRRSLIFLQQVQRSYTTARDQAAVGARNALRRIVSAREQVELQRRNVQVAQARLDLANSLLRQPLLNPLPGLSQSNRDVVEAQQSLLTAQDSLDSARAALQVQVLSYYRDTGTLRLDPEAGTLARAVMREKR